MAAQTGRASSRTHFLWLRHAQAHDRRVKSHLQHLKAGDATAPAKLTYVRSAELQAAYALDSKHVDYNNSTLPSNIEVSLPQLRKAARKICDLITNTIDEEYIVARVRDDMYCKIAKGKTTQHATKGRGPAPQTHVAHKTPLPL